MKTKHKLYEVHYSGCCYILAGSKQEAVEAVKGLFYQHSAAELGVEMTSMLVESCDDPEWRKAFPFGYTHCTNGPELTVGELLESQD